MIFVCVYSQFKINDLHLIIFSFEFNERKNTKVIEDENDYTSIAIKFFEELDKTD